MNLRTRISRLEQTLQPKEDSEQPAYPDECICYPKLRYGLSFKSDEMRAAEELPCPLHGNRIPNPQETVYVPKWVQDGETIVEVGQVEKQGTELEDVQGDPRQFLWKLESGAAQKTCGQVRDRSDQHCDHN